MWNEFHKLIVQCVKKPCHFISAETDIGPVPKMILNSCYEKDNFFDFLIYAFCEFFYVLIDF